VRGKRGDCSEELREGIPREIDTAQQEGKKEAEETWGILTSAPGRGLKS